MSDEQRISETDEPEVEGHARHTANDEATDETENGDEVEGHVRSTTPRVDQPRLD